MKILYDLAESRKPFIFASQSIIAPRCFSSEDLYYLALSMYIRKSLPIVSIKKRARWTLDAFPYLTHTDHCLSWKLTENQFK